VKSLQVISYLVVLVSLLVVGSQCGCSRNEDFVGTWIPKECQSATQCGVVVIIRKPVDTDAYQVKWVLEGDPMEWADYQREGNRLVADFEVLRGGSASGRTLKDEFSLNSSGDMMMFERTDGREEHVVLRLRRAGLGTEVPSYAP